jgi:hypothetical protein
VKAHVRIAIAVIVFLLAAACAATAEYDPQFDSQVQALGRNVDSFLTDLEVVVGTPEGDYRLHQPFYDQVWLAFEELQLRAGEQPANGATSGSLNLLSENLHHLERLHREGLTAAEVPILRKILGAQFQALGSMQALKKTRPASTGVVSKGEV